MCRQLQKYKHINQYYFWNVHNHRVLGVFDGTNVGVRTHLRSSRGRERGTRRRGGAVLMNTNKNILRKSADDDNTGVVNLRHFALTRTCSSWVSLVYCVALFGDGGTMPDVFRTSPSALRATSAILFFFFVFCKDKDDFVKRKTFVKVSSHKCWGAKEGIG